MSDISTLIASVDRLCQRMEGERDRQQRDHNRLCDRMDGLLCHFSAVDAEYGRVVNTLRNHEARLLRLEKEHQFEPEEKLGESSALFAAIKTPSATT